MKIQIKVMFVGNFHRPHASCFFELSILLISVITLIQVTDDVIICSFLKREATQSSETVVIDESTRRHI
jgi:hypothetical protein